MRYSPEHKQETHDRIVEKAAELFVAKGFKATGIKSLMEEAGLTNGGFYAHFDSKDDLLADVLEKRLERTRDMMGASFESEDAIRAAEIIADWYLSAAHRDNPREGCPIPTLSREIGDAGEAAQEAFSRGFDRIVGVVAAQVPRGTDEERREWAIGFGAMLIGGMVLARSVSDKDLSNELLDGCRAMVKRMARNELG